MLNRAIFLILTALTVLLITTTALAFSQTANEPAPQEIGLGNVSGAVVTLYYYDPETEAKGAIVNLPDNPQYVQWDEQLAAPGTYTFSRVPEGTYYIEAVHDHNSWFAIATVYRGTTTANVAIPPVNWTEAVTPTPGATPISTLVPSPPVVATPTPAPSSAATPAPGMGAFVALAGIGIMALYLLGVRNQQ